MQNRDNLDESSALAVVNKRFNENKLIYKNLYNFEFGDDLSVFDKIIQTDGINAEQVLEIAKTTVRELLDTKQLENLVEIDEDMTNPENGTYYNKEQLKSYLNMVNFD